MQRLSLLVFVLLLPFNFAFAQLRLYPLVNDESRYKEPIVKNSSRARIESVATDSVFANVKVKLTGGINPRCNTSPSLLEFSATGINTGTQPTYEWFVNGISSGTGPQFSYTSNGIDQVVCKLTSNLACASQKVDTDTFNVEIATILEPSLSIQVLQGNDPDCTGKNAITLTGLAVNGGINPSARYSWWINRNKIANDGNQYLALDSLRNVDTVKLTMTNNGAIPCVVKDTIVTSPIYRRKISRTIPPITDLRISSVTNDNCTGLRYEIEASSTGAGQSPTYQWYKNNQFVGSTIGNTFSVPLAQNGDEVKVTLISSLSCANPKRTTSNSIQRVDTLSLPFFDDFAGEGTSPDVNNWIKNGGAFINNTYPVQPPTHRVATMDGLRYNGSPYDSLLAGTTAVTDRLISNPIDLSSYTTLDTVGIHFFYQPEGIGEIPDSTQGDKINLYFKNSVGDWINVWEKKRQKSQPFTRMIIPVANDSSNNFFHRGFQFKFETTGRLAGSFDVWNIDYVYLGRKVSSKISFKDQSFSVQPKSLLKYYTAMPFDHFKNSQPDQLADTTANLYTSINNLNNIFNNILFRGDVYNNQTNELIANLLPTSGQSIDADSLQFPVYCKPDKTTNLIPTGASAPLELRYQFTLSGDQNNPDGLGIDYTRNNTISGLCILDNFYAYDDGSAEYAIGLNGISSYLAVQFTSQQPDSLRQIAVNFTKIRKVLIGQSINMMAWSKLPSNANNSAAPEILFKKNFALKYQSNQDGWTVYDISPAVAVKDTFYIGYQQVSNDEVTLGFDKNTNASNRIFFSISSNKWESTNDTFSKGSILIRPVFGIYKYLNPIDEPYVQKDITMYPNPARDVIHFDANLDELSIFDISGKQHIKLSGYIAHEQINLTSLPKGLYFTKISTRKFNICKKLILE